MAPVARASAGPSSKVDGASLPADRPLTAPVAWLAVAAPWGPIHLAASDDGLVGLEVLSPTEVFVDGVTRRVGLPAEEAVTRRSSAWPAAELARRASDAVGAFLAGRHEELERLPLDLRTRSEWDRRILLAVREVPYGAVTSYGRLAGRVGSPGAARAVGGAVGRNPLGLVIPCHRVIAGDGSLGGYGGDRWGSREALLSVKLDLLDREGVRLPVERW